MKTIVEKLIEKRNSEQPANTDYSALYKLMFGENSDVDFNAGLEQKTERALVQLDPLARYLLEERYLYGRSAERLAEDIRGTLDMNEFTLAYLEEMFRSFRKMFFEKTSEIFGKMRENNFDELKYLDEQCGFAPLPDEDYEESAFKSPADVLRIAIDKYEKYGDRFEDAYTDEEFDELRDLYIDEMDDIFDAIRDNGFYETNFQNNILALPPDSDYDGDPTAFRSVAEILRDCIEEFYNSFYGNRHIFDGYTGLGKNEEEGFARWMSGNLEAFVNELCERAAGELRRKVLGERPEETS